MIKAVKRKSGCVCELKTRDIPALYLSEIIVFTSHPGKGVPVKSNDIKAI